MLYYSVRESTGALGEIKETRRRQIFTEDEANMAGYIVDFSNNDLGSKAKKRTAAQKEEEKGKQDEDEDEDEEVFLGDLNTLEREKTTYITQEKDETPRSIAKQSGMTIPDFVKMNLQRHPTLKHDSKFKKGTDVTVLAAPLRNSSKKRLMPRKHLENRLKKREKPDDSLSADKREAALDEREAALNEREAALDEREAALNEREAALNEREAALDERQATLGEIGRARDRAMDERERRLNKEQAKLELQKNDVAIKCSSLSLDVESMKSNLKEALSTLEKAEMDITNLQKDAQRHAPVEEID